MSDIMRYILLLFSPLVFFSDAKSHAIGSLMAREETKKEPRQRKDIIRFIIILPIYYHIYYIYVFCNSCRDMIKYKTKI